jgi:hypothetical protein
MARTARSGARRLAAILESKTNVRTKAMPPKAQSVTAGAGRAQAVFQTLPLLAIAAVALACTVPAHAAETSISGMWMVDHDDFHRPDPPPLTQAAKDFAEANKNLVMTSSGKKCLPYGMPSLMTTELAVEIIESPDRVAVISEQTQLPRTIYLNTDKHPDPLNVPPGWNGHSIGHWEGKTLVIDTANLNDRVSHISFFAMPSKTTHIVERWHVEDNGQTLVSEMTFEDPAVLAKPWVRTFHYHRMPPGSEVWEYICDLDDPAWTSALGERPAGGN